MTSRFHSFRAYRGIPLLLVCALILLVPGNSVFADKTGTTLNLTITPEEPGIDESFTLTGVLSATDGSPLGNKRVILEFSKSGPADEESFEVMANKATDREGFFSFFRPNESEPAYLRVTYGGNDQFSPATSEAIAVKGIEAGATEIDANRTGSVVIYSKPSGARVVIDDIERGVTPLTVPKLSEGDHILTVSLAGFEDQTMEIFATHKFDNNIEITMK